MKKATAQENKKWEPKWRWIESTTIDLKTGKSKNKYFIPKNSEEERRLKAEYDEKMNQVFDILFEKVIRESNRY